MSVCKQCIKRRGEINWQNYPYIRPHLLWLDENGTYHFYPEYENVTYCRKEVVLNTAMFNHNCGYIPEGLS